MRHESTPWPGAPAAHRPRGLNSLYTRPQLEGVLQRERARADRIRGEFSLLLFRARSEDRRHMLRLARLLLGRCRAIDELGWFDEECVAALLPYTGAAGARAFAESALKLALRQSIHAICRVYTYPSAWYVEDDGQGPGSEQDSSGKRVAATGVTVRVAALAEQAEGYVHAAGSGGGNGHNGNGHAHGNGSGTGHNGQARDNCNGTDHNGHAPDAHGHNGYGSGQESAAGADAATPDRRPVDADAGAAGVSVSGRRRGDFEPSDLMPFVLQGVADELDAPDAGAAETVESLLVRPVPWWKRCIDLAGASVGLLVLSPVMVAAALAIKGTSRGPVLFRQRRAGIGGRPFWIYKFRTMVTDADAQKANLRPVSEQDGPAFKLARDPRVTRVGRILRETSLDELPQLWNVIKGDMSLVGPRPLPLDESAGCEQWQRRRLDVTPGLTCIWQVKGRSRVTFNEWMRMDLNYIRRRTLWHDVKILAETIPAVLLRRGAR